MRLIRNSWFVTMVLAACLASSALAQGVGRTRRIYNPSTETTVKGTVEKVTEITGRRAWNGVHLTLKSDDQTYGVHVGRSDYVSGKGFAFSAGDQIEVTGSKVELGGAETIIAREIKKDGKTLTLRDSQGIPKWSGGRRPSY
jgi:hypothetical protein